MQVAVRELIRNRLQIGCGAKYKKDVPLQIQMIVAATNKIPAAANTII
jgi:hypothetical protein